MNIIERLRQRFAKRQLTAVPAPNEVIVARQLLKDPYDRRSRRLKNRQRERSRAVTRQRGQVIRR